MKSHQRRARRRYRGGHAAVRRAGCAGGRADQDRLQHGADRPLRRRRQNRAPRLQDLGGGDQRQGRPPRPAGQAGLLRRPEQPGAGAGHLHQADRRRQGRPPGVELRHQPRGSGDAGRDPAQPAVLRPVRPGGERAVPLPEILLDAAVRPRAGQDLRAGLFRPGDGAEPEAEDAWRSSAPMPNSSTRPPTARAITPRPPGSTSSTTAPIRRPRSISPRSSAPSGRRNPISSTSPPIRPIRSAFCARSARSD